MSVDYDLVIIGNTPAGVEAAIRAARCKARVALVTQQDISASNSGLFWEHPAALVDLTHQFPEACCSSPSPIGLSHGLFAGPLASSQFTPKEPDWHFLQNRMKGVAANLETLASPTMLASLGIDVIGAQGEFCRKPTQGFTVNGRFLSARAYLLALGPRPVLPHISGLVTADCGTVESLSSQLAQWEKGRNLVLLGEGMIAVGLAQALSRLGFQIRLLTSELDILSGLDSEVARFLQVQLEMEGVQVINLAEISRVEVRQGKKWLWCQGQEIAVDEMILATQSSLLAETLVESLNLEAVGVKWSAQGIRHNAKLQTTNPRIYVCEGQMNGHWSSHVASYEAAIALKNVLLYPGFKASYQGLPLILNTEPGIAWAGLTEPQAKKQYGEKIWVLQRSFNTLPKAQIRSDLTGFCKLIVHANGKLLGAHLVGHQASEGIGAIALAMQQQIPIQKLADLVLPFPTLTEIIVHTAQDWNHQRLKQNRWLQDLWDVFFDWRRSWGR